MSLHYQYTPYILSMLGTAVFMAALGLYGWRHRTVPGAIPFVGLMGTAAAIALTNAVELAGADMPTKIIGFKMRSICMLLSANAAFCFALEYASPGRWLTRRNLVLLSIPVLVNILLTFIDDVYHLMWSGFWDDGILHNSATILTTAFIAYGMLLLLLNTVVFISLFIRSPLHRWPIGVILLGGLVPRVMMPLYTMGVNPVAPMHPVILMYNLTGLMFVLALFRFRVFDVVPVARDLVIARMREGMLVLDAHNRLVELNRAAEEFLSASGSQVVGKDIVQVLRASPGLLQALGEPGAGHPAGVEIGQAHRRYEVHVSRLTGARGEPLGQLMLLHEATVRKQAQVQVLQQQRALAVLQERARLARDLHDGIGQVLGYAKLQAQAAVELLAQGQLATAEDYLAHLVGVAQEAQAEMQAYALDTQRATSQALSLLGSLRQLLRHFSEHFGIATQLIVSSGWGDAAVEPAERDQLLRIIQEALANVRKHAHAHGVWVSVGECDDQLHVAIADDGVGFDLSRLAKSDGGEDGHKFGLRSMRERATDMHGSVQIESAPGQGTQIFVQAPLRKERP